MVASCCVGARSCIAAETRGGEEMNALSTSVEDVDSLGACTDALDKSGRGERQRGRNDDVWVATMFSPRQFEEMT